MAVIGTRTFRGEIPRAEPYLLGENNAQMAVDCDFARGSLAPIKTGLMLRNSMGSNPVRGVYTEDGINFYTWDQETYAFQSPVIDDTNNRLYYLTPSEGVFKVASKLGMGPGGPKPLAGNTWKAGVPRPTVAPTLTAVDRTTLPDYPLITVSVEAWWEDTTGKDYNRTTSVVTTVTPLREYSFNIPAQPVVTGQVMKLAAKLTFTNVDGLAEILQVTVRAGASARSNALPGGIEAVLTQTSSAAAKISLSWGVRETRAYTYTYRNTWSEEGAPAPAATISVTYIQDVRIGVTAGNFTGYRPFSEYQIYRTFGTTAAYLPVSVTGSGLTFTDSSSKPDPNKEGLQSTAWTPPPDSLDGLELMPTGWFAAYNGKTLYMSEPYRPHAWPYNTTFPTAIRGIKAGAQALVVTTMDGLYLVVGQHPASAQQMKTKTPQPGAAQRAMADIDGAVAYASNDGIVMVDGSSGSLEVSQVLFDRATWRGRYGDVLLGNLRFAYHDGALVGVPDVVPLAGQAHNAFLLRMDGDAGNFTRLSARYDSMFRLPVNDALYFAQGSSIYRFAEGTNGTFDWWSREFVFPMEMTFGCGYIRCGGQVRLRIYADGELVDDLDNLSSGHFRLKDQLPRAQRWSYRLTGSGTVYEIFLARGMQELRNV